MKFLDAGVKSPLVFVSATVDEGNIVVFGPQESYIENTSTGRSIPTSTRTGVLVIQLDAQAGSRTANAVTFDEPHTNARTPFFQAAGVNQNVEEIHERCKTKTENQARKGVHVTRIEQVADVEHEKSEEAGGRGRDWRKEDHANT